MLAETIIWLNWNANENRKNVNEWSNGRFIQYFRILVNVQFRKWKLNRAMQIPNTHTYKHNHTLTENKKMNNNNKKYGKKRKTTLLR